MQVLFFVLSCLALVSDVYPLHAGIATTVGQHPTQVAITLPGGRFCSGTVIHATHVLTAARCLLDDNNELMVANLTVVRAGAIGAADVASFVTHAVALFPHPLFTPFSGEHDIAVIRTQQQFIVNVNISTPNIDLAVRYGRVVPDGSVCTVAGWMAPTAAVPNPSLVAADVTVLGRDACAQQYSAGVVHESMMCARSVAATANRPALCESNRGAGLFRGGQLVGVASGGFACATPNSNEPGVYTQVRMYDNWIQQQFIRTQIPAAGPTPHPGQEAGAAATTVSILLLGAVSFIAFFHL